MKKEYKIGVCGYCNQNITIPNGQTIKTMEVAKILSHNFGGGSLLMFDYSNCRKHPFLFIFNYINFLKKCKSIILFPDANAYILLIPVAIFFRGLFNCKIYYDVVGAWLPSALARNFIMRYFIKRLDALFIETHHMEKQLLKFGVHNLMIVNNFKDNKICSIESSLMNNQPPYKLCFCSRVEPQKGVLDMIDVVKRLNANELLYTLDIYGGIEKNFISSFEKLLITFPDYIQYKGELNSDEVSAVINGYFLQLFPTKYLTEGIPGSIIDSFYAGVPVVASRWNSASEVIIDNYNGFLFNFNDYGMMYEKLIFLSSHPEAVINIRKNCIESAKKYSPENAVKPIIDILL